MEDGISQIVASLEVIYSPASSNDNRHDAQLFLDTLKRLPDSPLYGFQLALPDNKYNFIVRHFGLNLLLNSITKCYSDWDLGKREFVRNGIIELASKIDSTDPNYLKEKIAFIWCELAKRSWGTCLTSNSNETFTDQEKMDSWSSMDSDLLNLWNHNLFTRELSLIILRSLFEDIYLIDDPIVSQRSSVLSSLCPEIVISESILLLQYEANESIRTFASNSEGWLIKWCSFLDDCLNNKLDIDANATSNLICKILHVFKTSLYWMLPIAFRSVNLLPKLLQLIQIPNIDIKIKILTVDCFQILFTRTYSSTEDFNDIIGTIFETSGLEVLFNLFQSIVLDADNIDENDYSLMKKVVEMIVGLSEYLQVDNEKESASKKINNNNNGNNNNGNNNISNDKTNNNGNIKDELDDDDDDDDLSTKFKLPENADVINYFKLVLATTKHESLVISSLSLQFWCSMLRIDELSEKSDFQSIMPDLLETSASRLINYQDYDDELNSKKYLEIDFENSPSELNNFLNNFRKLNDDIVRIIMCKKPKDGLQWLANKLSLFYSSPIGLESLNNPKLTYKGKNSEAYIYGCCEFSIIEACVKGISRWLIWYVKDDMEEIKSYLIQQVDELCKMLLRLEIKDPMLLRKYTQTLVQFTPLLKNVKETMFNVLSKVIESCTFEYPNNASDEDRELIRDLRTSGGTELNRLAYLMPESLKDILDELENVISNLLQSKKLSDHEAVAFKSFLLVVSQRSSIDNKDQRFSNIVDPELIAWSAPDTEKGLMDLHWFMARLGIVKIAEYFQSRGITPETNLLLAEMDDTGRALKKELKDQWSSVFPIRATRIFIQYTIERLDHKSSTYQNLLKLWKPRIKPILPHILQLIYQIQAYHNPANWVTLPVEVQAFVKYSCQERFWQQGVSIQSKESFMDESVKAMHTLRDFADSVGHIVRYTREYAYLTISSISELEETLYEIPGSATMLWKALTGEPIGITLHSWRHMINLVVRNIIKNCPITSLSPFMDEFIPQVLGTLDQLLLSRWSIVYNKGLQLEGNESDEQMSEEMMEEHMLRQLTAVIDRMLIDLIGQHASSTLNERQLKTRELIFNNLIILAPLLNLLCHIITFKDSRCSFNAILIVKHMIQDLISLNNEQVDKFLSENLIQTLLQVLNDKFFQDTHPEAAYTLTIMYMGLRYKSSYPSMVLQKSLNITSKEISEFEIVLMNCKKLRERRNLFLQLIQDSKKQNGEEQDEEERLKDRKKQIENNSSINKRIKKLSSMEDPLDNGSSLNDLFGNE